MSGLAELIVGRTWQGGDWMRTAKPISAWRRGVRGRRATEKAGVTSPGRPRWHFRQRHGLGPAQLKGVVARR